MNNVSSLKINKNESPKTPGGISKSLLTPCRRLGLSRNWKRKGPSPFISPLSSTEEVKQEKTETRKRKQRINENELEQSPKTPEVSQEASNDAAEVSNNIDIDKTPSRNVELPRRKKSKTLLSAIKCQENTQSPTQEIKTSEDPKEPENLTKHVEVEPVCTPKRHKSKIRPKKSPLLKSTNKEQNSSDKPEVDIACRGNLCDNTETKLVPIPEKSPKELTKECIVVIQKKIFKQNSSDLETLNIKSETCNINNKNHREEKSGSQVLFDSDSDDVPLGKLNKNDKVTVTDQVINLDEDDDFTDSIKPTIKKLEGKNMTPKETELKLAVKKTKEVKHKIDKSKKSILNVETSKPSQTSFDDEEDFEFDNKKTILIRKSYNKVTMPLKAKSTGSISQKDIDDLKARIEAKKKLLIAKSMTEDTKELRELVKKWQTGCQTALMELMDLMKSNFPDKQNMDYSEILQTLKIPASLVGYDSDNDCFITPDDTTILLSGFNL